MATKETYLYFGDNKGGNAAGDSVTYPASTYLGLDPISATTSRISFKALAGTAADDDILFTHASGKYKELCQAMAILMNSTSGKLVVVYDEDNSIVHKVLSDFGVAPTEIEITLG
tara:strand:+ start:811 stop:1155 length:345 start_codon:yes stop_codon:yes gene_type:complete